MNDMSRRFRSDALVGVEPPRVPRLRLPGELTAERARDLLEAAGARRVSIMERAKSGRLWAFFSYLGVARVWGLRTGAMEANFARDVARELATTPVREQA